MEHIGIGFRKEFGEALLADNSIQPAFIEVAPENWLEVGGNWKRLLEKAAERFPIYTHGLSLSIGSPDPLDKHFLKKIRHFLDDWGIAVYSEHLSYSKVDNAHLYDLLPIPFRKDAIDHVVNRIDQVQEILGRRLILEIVSYYSPIAAEMREVEFINEILNRSGCGLLFDINNIYVNGFNHGYDPWAFISELNTSQVAYIHMAGHERVSDDLIIDTHGEAIIDPVYELFEKAWNLLTGPVPVLLERDFNIPKLSSLHAEMLRLEAITQKKNN
jgi:uncharacterized protein (UPF0276 family)